MAVRAIAELRLKAIFKASLRSRLAAAITQKDRDRDQVVDRDPDLIRGWIGDRMSECFALGGITFIAHDFPWTHGL